MKYHPICDFRKKQGSWLTFGMRTLGVSEVDLSFTTLYFNPCVGRVVKFTWMWPRLERMTFTQCGRPRLPQCLQSPNASCSENSTRWVFLFSSKLNDHVYSFCKEKEKKRVGYKALVFVEDRLSKTQYVWEENVIAILREVLLYRESLHPMDKIK